MVQNTFKFIVYDDPTKAVAPSNLRTIKSQAARHHWAEDANHRRATRRGQRNQRPHRVPLSNFESGFEHASIFSNDKSSESDNVTNPSRSLSPHELLGAGRVDPFQTYPVPFQLYFPEIIDHYIVDMAVDVPEIDGPGKRGLLRTKWFPLVMTEPATFLVVILLAASHLYSVRNTSIAAVNLLRIKESAIQAINEGLSCGHKAQTDAMVGAVAKICSYEAMYGDMHTYEVHMRGLRHMVDMRGGLDALGLDGVLKRICLWIDLNAAHLNGTQRFFEQTLAKESYEPNPGQFVGSWN